MLAHTESGLPRRLAIQIGLCDTLLNRFPIPGNTLKRAFISHGRVDPSSHSLHEGLGQRDDRGRPVLVIRWCGRCGMTPIEEMFKVID
jgi:hypothetical protein